MRPENPHSKYALLLIFLSTFITLVTFWQRSDVDGRASLTRLYRQTCSAVRAQWQRLPW